MKASGLHRRRQLVAGHGRSHPGALHRRSPVGLCAPDSATEGPNPCDQGSQYASIEGQSAFIRDPLSASKRAPLSDESGR